MIDFKVTGAKEVLRGANDASNDLRKTRGANLAAAITLQKWVIKNIESQGNNHQDSKFKWPPLKPATIKRRRQQGRGAKMLQDTGRLKGAFRATATNQFGQVVNNVGYAGVHEEGIGKVPQRKIWPSINQAVDIVRPVYEKFVDDSLDGLK